MLRVEECLKANKSDSLRRCLGISQRVQVVPLAVKLKEASKADSLRRWQRISQAILAVLLASDLVAGSSFGYSPSTWC